MVKNLCAIFKPDYETFECLKICKNAFETGGFATAIVHAANEKAVDLFLKGELKFLQIAKLIKLAVDEIKIKNEVFNVESILKVIQKVQIFTEEQARFLV